MGDNLTIDGWEDAEYKAFVDKFKAKKTTDDCYTPDNVYEAVAAWVATEYQLDRETFVRPFFPGGDYERFEYPEGCAVVDNPPFSILAKIIAFYSRRGIRFFLFAPSTDAVFFFFFFGHLPAGRRADHLRKRCQGPHIFRDQPGAAGPACPDRAEPLPGRQGGRRRKPRRSHQATAAL